MTPKQRAMKRFMQDVKKYEAYGDWNYADVAQLVVDEYTVITHHWAGGDFYERLIEGAHYIELLNEYLETHG